MKIEKEVFNGKPTFILSYESEEEAILMAELSNCNPVRSGAGFLGEEGNRCYNIRFTPNHKIMTHPQQIEVIKEKATYRVPFFKVTNDGLEDAGFMPIEFCKGNKADEMVDRQDGLFTETIIAVAKKYLEDNNVGELSSRETSTAITKLDEALMWLGKRAADRAARGVQGTYQK